MWLRQNPVRDLAAEERGMPEALLDAASAGRKCGLRDAGMFLKMHLGILF
jgi:hypothetical protein